MAATAARRTGSPGWAILGEGDAASATDAMLVSELGNLELLAVAPALGSKLSLPTMHAEAEGQAVEFCLVRAPAGTFRTEAVPVKRALLPRLTPKLVGAIVASSLSAEVPQVNSEVDIDIATPKARKSRGHRQQSGGKGVKLLEEALASGLLGGGGKPQRKSKANAADSSSGSDSKDSSSEDGSENSSSSSESEDLEAKLKQLRKLQKKQRKARRMRVPKTPPKSGDSLDDVMKLLIGGGGGSRDGSVGDLLQLMVLKELKKMRKRGGASSSSESSGDERAGTRHSKFRTLHRLRRKFEKDPNNIWKAYRARTQEKLHVHSRKQVWSYVDLPRLLKPRFGRMQGLWRIHFYLADALMRAENGQHEHMIAYVVLLLKSIQQVSHDAGDWSTAVQLLPVPDPCDPVGEHGLDEHELEAIGMYKSAPETLKTKQGSKVVADEDDADGEAPKAGAKRK